MRDYPAIATQYATDVIDGRIPACKWARLACQRQINDLARQDTPGFPYVFNPELIDRWTVAPPSSASRSTRRVTSSACLASTATD